MYGECVLLLFVFLLCDVVLRCAMSVFARVRFVFLFVCALWIRCCDSLFVSCYCCVCCCRIGCCVQLFFLHDVYVFVIVHVVCCCLCLRVLCFASFVVCIDCMACVLCVSLYIERDCLWYPLDSYMEFSLSLSLSLFLSLSISFSFAERKRCGVGWGKKNKKTGKTMSCFKVVGIAKQTIRIYMGFLVFLVPKSPNTLNKANGVLGFRCFLGLLTIASSPGGKKTESGDGWKQTT